MNPATLATTPEALLELSRKHLERTEEFRAAFPGADFNVFEILQIGHRETKTHTPLLAELLNPNGSHGLGTYPLSSFLERLGIPGMDAYSARIKTEHTCRGSNGDQDGRIDILISDHTGMQVCIENKIYAVEQPDQVGRYQRAFPQARFVYLTLDGDAPTTTISGHASQPICASYREHVHDWLKECESRANHSAPVREILIQYRTLIQRLTGQGGYSQMDKELTEEILKNGSSIEAFFRLCAQKKAVTEEICERLAAIIQKVACDTGTIHSWSSRKWHEKNQFFAFSTPAMKSEGLKLAFEFDSPSFRGFFFGLMWNNSPPANPKNADASSLTTPMVERFKKRFVKNDWTKLWPAWVYLEEHRDWGEPEFNAILSGEFQAILSDTVHQVLELQSAVENP